MKFLRRACFPLLLLISFVELAGCGGGSPGGNAPRGSINNPPSNLQYPTTNETYPIGATVNIKPTIDGVVYSCSAAPKLPVGLSIDNNTCSITGSPTTINDPNSQYVITASNDAGATMETLQITVEGTIGGTVTGYSTGSGLTLHNDTNGESINVNSNASSNKISFTFPTALKGKDKYTVSVSAQPSGPAQICTVSQNQGTMTVGGGNISSISVNCLMARTIGGTVSGLAGTGLTLLDNGVDKLSISANGSFTFPTALATGKTYTVTVFADPSHLTQSCNVSSGTGPVGSTDITSVKVVCTTEWNWAGGSQTVNTPGTYPASAPGTGTPGARYASVEWTDSSGQLWLFGGYGCDSSVPCTLGAAGIVGTVGDLNDLWMYNLGTQKWTWEGGSTTSGVLNTYPAKVGDSGTPGARDTPMSWTVGNTLWMFGGYGADSTGTAGTLNDLWKYVPGSGWFWEGGSKTVNAPGIYTATATTTVYPGARYGAATWVDSNGHLWLFGGYGCDSSSPCTLGTTFDELNDLWMYDPASGWTWEGGSETKNATGIYIASAGVSVFPGAREGAAAWVRNGQLWLFGGFGVGKDTSPIDTLNDFWKYVPGSGWTWEGGSQSIGGFGNYVSVGSTGFPSARDYPSVWVDGVGRLWMYGGYGVASKTSTVAHVDDLWMYDPGKSTWTWEGGTALGDTTSTYPPSGVSFGIPGSRYVAPNWADSSGNLWLFGGWGYDATQTDSIGYLSDMWVLQP